MQELYAELKSLRDFDADKVTFGTYYQALVLCKKDTQLRQSESTKKSSYIPADSLRQNEEAKTTKARQFTSESDFDDFLDRENEQRDTSGLMSHILENSLYIEWTKEC